MATPKKPGLALCFELGVLGGPSQEGGGFAQLRHMITGLGLDSLWLSQDLAWHPVQVHQVRGRHAAALIC